MTDNKVLIDTNGTESVFVSKADGLAIKLLKEKGIEQIIISSEKNDIVKHRANKLGINVLYGVESKLDALIKFCKEKNYNLKQVAYVGNDINDLEVMLKVGISICPCDAQFEIKKISKIVLHSSGGFGIIRELFNLIK